MYEIEFYKDKNGNSEILEYMTQLQNNNNKSNRIKANKIKYYVSLLKQQGLKLNKAYIKHLEGEIWELRPLRDRILFASWYNNKFILLSVFMKDTRKTPKREIEKAKKYLEDYKKRSDENEYAKK